MNTNLEKSSLGGDVGAVYFMGALLWMIFGWVPWFVFIGTYLLLNDMSSIAGMHPMNVTAFVLSYLFTPLWFGIIAYPLYKAGKFVFKVNEWIFKKVTR